MSLYNMVHGTNKLAGLVLAVLGLSQSQIPRFRDAHFDGENFVILTRTGGGNREAYEEENDFLTTIQGYVEDRDAAFDSTYAEFVYQVPEKFQYLLEKLVEHAQTKSFADRWVEELDVIKNAGLDDPRVSRMATVFKELFDSVDNPKT